MITDNMVLTTTADINVWADDMVSAWAGDYDKNLAAMIQAIQKNMPGWGCTKSDLDWDVVEARAYEILDTL